MVKLFRGDDSIGTVGAAVSIMSDHVEAHVEKLPALSSARTLQYHILVASVITAEEFVVTDEYCTPDKSGAVDMSSV